MQIVLGSTSKLKVRAVEAACRLWKLRATVLACKTPSGVSIQPRGKEKTTAGALQRAKGAREKYPDGQLWIGMQSGFIQDTGERWWSATCVAILRRDQADKPVVVYSDHFPIPAWIAHEVIREWTELGKATQKYGGGEEKDPMNYFSGGVIRREHLLAQAVACALAPIVRADLYENARA